MRSFGAAELVVCLSLTSVVAAGEDITWSSEHRQGDGVRVTGRQRVVTERPTTRTNSAARVTYEYRYVALCPGNTLERPNEFDCETARTVCQGHEDRTAGPLADVWRRQITPTPSAWTFITKSCFPPRGPGHHPAITLDMIRTAWSHTPFSKPDLRIEPPGGRTLINIPTYFMAVIPSAGYGPGEINTVTMLGHAVRINAQQVHYRYHFGDGSPPLSTVSPGGPWPDGDVTHTYLRPDVVTVRIDATYAGAYSIDGGPWQPIPQPVTITGAPQHLDVATAHNELVLD